MKHLTNIINLILFTIVMVISSCSQDEYSLGNNKFDNLKFNVSVTNSSATSTRAASDGKTTWTKGDQIYTAIDGSENNLCLLEYDGEDWKVTKLSDQATFNDSGKLNAVFADKLSYKDGIITTFGDILYTKDGTYEKDGNVVYIKLNMSQRPVAKIKINGVPKGFWISDIHEFTKLNIANMTWEDTNSNGKLNCEPEDNDNYTYYGIIDEANNKTTVKLINGKGAYYQQTFDNKTIKAGDFITINGPLLSDKWDSLIPLEGLSSTKVASIPLGDKISATNFFNYIPNDATNKKVTYQSTNEDIATVDADGTITGNALGTTSIKVIAEDGNQTCDIQVQVIDIASCVNITLTGTSTSITSSGFYFGRTYTIKNNSDFDIYINSIGTTNFKDINQELKAGASLEETLYFGYNITPQITVKFTYNGKTYEAKSN